VSNSSHRTLTDEYVCGIDIGTSKVAAVVIEAQTGRSVAAASREHHATVPGLAPGHDEQDVTKLLSAVFDATRNLPRDALSRVRAVGVTGQMHGVLVVDADARPLTHLVTWQDQRCDTEFLEELTHATGVSSLRTGFGAATLAWLKKSDRLPARSRTAATIHDFLVQRLCGLPRPVTDPTDAASWGLFDLTRREWQRGAWVACGIDGDLLPTVVPSGTCVGRVSREAADATGLPPGIPVAAALGDNQASLVTSLRGHRPECVLALTLGTGGQLSAVMPRGFEPPPDPEAQFEYRPFPGKRFAAVAAALCGGSAFAWLVDAVRNWTEELGLPVLDMDATYMLLDRLGQSVDGGGLDVVPRFRGERHAPSERGSIHGITPDNFTPANLARSLATGIVRNLKEMLPAACFEGRTLVVGSGNAIRRLSLLRTAARDVLALPLEIPPATEEAATGAALLAKGSIESETRRTTM